MQEKNTSETHSEISCDKVRLNDVCSHPLPWLVLRQLLMILSWCFSTGEWTTAGWRPQQTCISFRGGGEPGSAEEVRDQPSLSHLESNYTADGQWLRFLCCFHLLSPCIWSFTSLSADMSWTSCWKPREPTWRSCSVYSRWALTLLWCLCGIPGLTLLCLQGYASEMDNPAVFHLIPAPLQNKKEVLFGNMPEIYHFHKRWNCVICWSMAVSPERLTPLSSLYYLVLHLIIFMYHRTFLRELEQYTDCPELVGRCFLQRVSDCRQMQM